MNYIQEAELKSLKDRYMIDSMSSDDETIINQIELLVIDEVRAYISGKYDADYIFEQRDTGRNGVIVRIVLELMIYYLAKRMSSDEIPEYLTDDYERNIELLKDIGFGNLNPSLPLRDAELEGGITFVGSKPNNFYN